MVRDQLLPRGITNVDVLHQMGKIPRENFVLTEERHLAYRDGPLPIGQRQTISQPYIVAYMTEHLDVRPDHRVLEIGTGSGYQTALLSTCAAKVFTVEIVEGLAVRARHVLQEQLGLANIQFRIGNGFYGWPEMAPFDRIMLTAAPLSVPEVLFKQLNVGGKLIAPLGEFFQKLVIFEKLEDEVIKETPLLDVRFVPMTGEQPSD